jgi:hypothetical protein
VQASIDPAECHRGCLLLSHDDPVPARTTYNSAADVLSLLATPRLRPYFAAAGAADRVHVALCFKYTGLAQCADAAWLALADAFFAAANATLSAHALTVELILDGAATPTTRPCLIARWRPWNATWVIGAPALGRRPRPGSRAGGLTPGWLPGRDAMAAATSDDPLRGFDRFQINNMPEGGGGDPAANLRWGRTWRPAVSSGGAAATPTHSLTYTRAGRCRRCSHRMASSTSVRTPFCSGSQATSRPSRPCAVSLRPAPPRRRRCALPPTRVRRPREGVVRSFPVLIMWWAAPQIRCRCGAGEGKKAVAVYSCSDGGALFVFFFFFAND